MILEAKAVSRDTPIITPRVPLNDGNCRLHRTTVAHCKSALTQSWSVNADTNCRFRNATYPPSGHLTDFDHHFNAVTFGHLHFVTFPIQSGHCTLPHWNGHSRHCPSVRCSPYSPSPPLVSVMDHFFRYHHLTHFQSSHHSSRLRDQVEQKKYSLKTYKLLVRLAEGPVPSQYLVPRGCHRV